MHCHDSFDGQVRLVIAVVALFFLTGANGAYIGELPKEGQYKWEVEQVPNNVTVYWDYNLDGRADTVFACPVTGSGRLSTCDIKMETGERDYLFTNCPSNEPLYYLTSRQCWECLSCKRWLKGKDAPPLAANIMRVKCVQKN